VRSPIPIEQADLAPNGPFTPSNEHSSVEAKRCQERLDAATASSPIEFEAGSDNVNAVSVSTLKSVSLIALDCTGVLIEVQGHTDAAGTSAFNVNLTRRRAQYVVRYLVEKGVPPQRLRAVGYGDTRPLVPSDTVANQRKNRRIQFVVFDETAASRDAKK
jgi:outer membrane protein OmpA-like peptidoglycan-associated protein